MLGLVSQSRGSMRSHIRLRVPSRALSSRAPRLFISRSETITRTGTRLENRRSLSESAKGSFVDIQHQCSRCRLYSSTSSGAASPPNDPAQDLEQGNTSTLASCEIVDPSMLALKPDLEVYGGLPPLPPILNDATRQQVFTHRSVYARSRHDFEDSPNDPAPDNEVLEHQGDAVLGLVITDLVRDCYRTLRVGPATKIRALVVGNATLADISVKYGLPQHLRLHRASAITLKTSIHIQADALEAYIGGLYKDQGLEVVRSWLNVLFLPYVKEAYRVCRDQHGLPSPPPTPTLPHAPDNNPLGTAPSGLDLSQNPAGQPASQNTVGHLSLFNQYLQQKHMTVEWIFDAVKDEGTKVTPIWVVQAIVDGHQLAVGRASTKKGAQNEAAREGLVQLGISAPPE